MSGGNDYGLRTVLDMQRARPRNAYLNALVVNFHHFVQIYSELGQKFEPGCGGYLFGGQTYTYEASYFEKQEHLYELARRSTAGILELGTYTGGSALIMLFANPMVRITCVDISDRYAGPAIRYLNRMFGNRVELVIQPSLAFLQQRAVSTDLLRGYDLIHVDSSHTPAETVTEIALCLRLFTQGMDLPGPVLVMDDFGEDAPRAVVNLSSAVAPHLASGALTYLHKDWQNAAFRVHLDCGLARPHDAASCGV